MGKIKNLLATVACAALVMGCGGNGGGGPLVHDPVASAGIWSGTTTSGRAVLLATLSDGTFWALYSKIGTDEIAGMVQGTASSAGNNFNSEDMLDFNYEGLGLRPAILDATYSFRHSLNAVVRYSNEAVNFIANYIPSLGADIGQIVGSYTAESSSGGDFSAADFTISTSGVIDGGRVGCTFTGTLTPRSDIDAFNLSLNFTGGACATASVSGIALFDGGQLLATAVNPGRTSSFLLAGIRQ